MAIDYGSFEFPPPGGGSGSGFITAVANTNSIDLTVLAGVLTADLNLSSAAAGTGFFNANMSIQSDGLQVKLSIANTSTTGVLTSTDWNTFNNKQSTLTLGNLTDVGTDGIVVTGGLGAVIGSGTSIAQHVADTTHNGYLSSTDWNTFNGKQGTISFAAVGSTPNANGGGISGGVITLQPADGSNPGLLTSGSQTIGGAKTLNAILDLGSHKITSVTDPTSAQDAATKNYVDNALAAFQPIESAYAASTVNITGTYLNGTAGVGATFTITATGALSLDGVNPPFASRVLLKDQASGFQNGVYTVTVVGTTGVSPVLTRSLDYNTAAEMNAGNLIPVINGTVNAITSWLQTATITTVGTDALVFTQYSKNPSSYLSTALTSAHLFVGNASNIATDVAASGDLALANTGAFTLATVNSNVGSFTNANITVNAKGLVTAAANGTGASSNLSIAVKTTTYVIQNIDQLILYSSSGGAYTTTLPTAVGISGQIFYLKKTDSNTNLITVATTSGQTIGPYAGVTLATIGEYWQFVSDGSNWQILSHFADTEWAIYTPTTQGFGSPIGMEFEWRRRGSDCLVNGELTIQSGTGSEAQVGLPSTLTSKSTTYIQSRRVIGYCTSAGTNSTYFGTNTMMIEPSVTYFTFSANTAGQGGLIKVAGNFFGNVLFGVFGYAPINNWYP